jgi:hypothetical protein
MSGDAGGWLWLLIDLALVAILAAALAYGIMAWRRRSATAERLGEEATDRLYQRPDPESRETGVTGKRN